MRGTIEVEKTIWIETDEALSAMLEQVEVEDIIQECYSYASASECIRAFGWDADDWYNNLKSAGIEIEGEAKKPSHATDMINILCDNDLDTDDTMLHLATYLHERMGKEFKAKLLWYILKGE